ncbi:hypothetical protein ATANTOWER_029210, partial [Ataeniobius toweri]|nr:hypothetical protein [Ataeniobius toweri]
IMSLHRLTFRLRPTVAHVRWLHTSRCVQQQEAVAVEQQPESISVFRTQEKEP